ncbi:MAG: tetratricopeptide repeat protein [Selenomonadaceae bacterium]|nr:tetratricopeptide repeat protein [Selenomonadaceae bacterium]
MKKFLTAVLAAGSLFLMPEVNAEIKTCTGTDEYIMSEFETIDIAKQRAKQKAERVAQEQAGVFVESNTEVINMMVTKDEVRTMTCGILKIVDVQYQLTPLEDGKSLVVKATVKADVDTDEINGWLNRPPQERSELVDKNLELQKAIEEQDKQIAELKSKLAAAESKQDKEKISAQFNSEDKNFLSNQKLEEAMKFYYARDFNGTFSLCTQAIELNPSNAIAYSIRGVIFYYQKDFNGALSDFNRAIQLNSSDYKNFYNRGLAYIKLNNYRAAAEDFDAALKLNPNDSDSRYNRDLCRRAMGY